MRTSHLMGFCLSFIACSTSAPEEGPPAAEALDVVAAWEANPPAIQSLLQALDEPDRWLAVQTLINERPQASLDPLCQSFTDPHQSACNAYKAKVSERPHLWGKAHQQYRTPTRGGPPRSTDRPANTGPSQTRFQIAPDQRPRLHDLAPLATNCPTDDVQCRIQKAIEAIRRNAFEEAARLCRSENRTWQSECFFRAGEEQASRSSKHTGRGTLRWAVDYCLASDQYAVECLDQAMIHYWMASPSAKTPHTDDWKPLIAHAESLLGEPILEDPQLLVQLQGRFWAGALHASYQRSTTLSGQPLDHLPAVAAPYIRSAAAFRWVQLESAKRGSWNPEITDLKQFGATLIELLEHRSEDSSPSRRLQEPAIKDFWQEDARGDEDMPALYYLGAARRSWSTDPLLDAQLALLEAFAQQGVALDLLRACADHAEPAIAWSAKRLLHARAQRP